jgi:organic hydroperoxide reductase OsmC/OhrA
MEHHYTATIRWTGNRGQGTQHYKAYDRNHTIQIENKAPILGSADPTFRGEAGRHNPEELFIASLSACHMLWYLHLCAVNGVIVTDYTDRASGTMQESEEGSGFFTEVTLSPVVTITDPAMQEKAISLHQQANSKCFIAGSVKCPVYHKPEIKVARVA